jgi:hypothetical protein
MTTPIPRGDEDERASRALIDEIRIYAKGRMSDVERGAETPELAALLTDFAEHRRSRAPPEAMGGQVSSSWGLRTSSRQKRGRACRSAARATSSPPQPVAFRPRPPFADRARRSSISDTAKLLVAQRRRRSQLDADGDAVRGLGRGSRGGRGSRYFARVIGLARRFAQAPGEDKPTRAMLRDTVGSEWLLMRPQKARNADRCRG